MAKRAKSRSNKEANKTPAEFVALGNLVSDFLTPADPSTKDPAVSNVNEAAQLDKNVDPLNVAKKRKP